MRIVVTRTVNYPRPGTPLTFEVSASSEPLRLPRDVADHIIRIGAGYAIAHQPSDKSGGVAALIERKRSQP
jgi:hypothetical protein